MKPSKHRCWNQKILTISSKDLCEPDRIRTCDRLLRREVLYPAELRARSFIVSTKTVSGWQDSNLRPPRPKRGAMTGLRYTPSLQNFAERQGLEPWRQLPVDRLAICSITTLAPLLNYNLCNN